MTVGAFCGAWAAEITISSASLTGATPVVVSKTDGSTVRGTISQVSPELLCIIPTAKPVAKKKQSDTPETPASATPEATEVEWKQIHSVSDGLTVRLAMDIWLAQQQAKNLCPTCHGERTVWCPVCKGTRHDPAAAVDCPTCKGELLVPCKTVGEKDGQIACPNSCLKLAVGQWSKDGVGIQWRTWRFGRATQTFSEHHLGDVMFTDLKAMPPISDQGKCPICGGTTKVDDPLCFGTGQIPCPTCVARKSAGPCPNNCSNGRVPCPTCGGTGLVKQ